MGAISSTHAKATVGCFPIGQHSTDAYGSNKRPVSKNSKKGLPSPPESPQIVWLKYDSVTIFWKCSSTSSSHDSINAYVVELTTNNKHWVVINQDCQETVYSCPLPDPTTTYRFRVRAKNVNGIGKPSSPSRPVCPMQALAQGDSGKLMRSSSVDAATRFNVKQADVGLLGNVDGGSTVPRHFRTMSMRQTNPYSVLDKSLHNEMIDNLSQAYTSNNVNLSDTCDSFLHNHSLSTEYLNSNELLSYIDNCLRCSLDTPCPKNTPTIFEVSNNIITIEWNNCRTHPHVNAYIIEQKTDIKPKWNEIGQTYGALTRFDVRIDDPSLIYTFRLIAQFISDGKTVSYRTPSYPSLPVCPNHARTYSSHPMNHAHSYSSHPPSRERSSSLDGSSLFAIRRPNLNSIFPVPDKPTELNCNASSDARNIIRKHIPELASRNIFSPQDPHRVMPVKTDHSVSRDNDVDIVSRLLGQNNVHETDSLYSNKSLMSEKLPTKHDNRLDNDPLKLPTKHDNDPLKSPIYESYMNMNILRRASCGTPSKLRLMRESVGEIDMAALNEFQNVDMALRHSFHNSQALRITPQTPFIDCLINNQPLAEQNSHQYVNLPPCNSSVKSIKECDERTRDSGTKIPRYDCLEEFSALSTKHTPDRVTSHALTCDWESVSDTSEELISRCISEESLTKRLEDEMSDADSNYDFD